LPRDCIEVDTSTHVDENAADSVISIEMDSPPSSPVLDVKAAVDTPPIHVHISTGKSDELVAGDHGEYATTSRKELREMCRRHSLQVGGSKEELIGRLVEALRS